MKHLPIYSINSIEANRVIYDEIIDSFTSVFVTGKDKVTEAFMESLMTKENRLDDRLLIACLPLYHGVTGRVAVVFFPYSKTYSYGKDLADLSARKAGYRPFSTEIMLENGTTLSATAQSELVRRDQKTHQTALDADIAHKTVSKYLKSSYESLEILAGALSPAELSKVSFMFNNRTVIEQAYGAVFCMIRWVNTLNWQFLTSTVDYVYPSLLMAQLSRNSSLGATKNPF
jgi:hypothetical protein